MAKKWSTLPEQTWRIKFSNRKIQKWIEYNKFIDLISSSRTLKISQFCIKISRKILNIFIFENFHEKNFSCPSKLSVLFFGANINLLRDKSVPQWKNYLSMQKIQRILWKREKWVLKCRNHCKYNSRWGRVGGRCWRDKWLEQIQTLVIIQLMTSFITFDSLNFKLFSSYSNSFNLKFMFPLLFNYFTFVCACVLGAAVQWWIVYRQWREHHQCTRYDGHQRFHG